MFNQFRFLLIPFFVLSLFISSCKPPEYDEKDLYSTKTTGVKLDNAGNVYVVGTAASSLESGQSISGDTDVLLIKFNNSGTQQWIRTLGSAGDDTATGLALDSANNIYITGNTDSQMPESSSDLSSLNSSLGDNDAFLMKYDSTGQFQWAKQTGSADEDYPQDIAIDTSNDYIYITGYAEASINGATYDDGNDIFLLRYDTTGKYISTRMLGSDEDDFAYGVAVDSTGDVYITGYTNDSDDDDFDGKNTDDGSDFFLVKYDASADTRTTDTLATDESESGYAIYIDASNDIYTVGNNNNDLDGQPDIKRTDYFLTQYSANPLSRNTAKTRIFGGDEHESAAGIVVDSNKNKYIVGSTDSDLYGNTNAGLYDVFITKVDSLGNMLWTKTLGTNHNDYGRAIAIDATGNIYIVGETYGELSTKTNRGKMDIFVAKYNSSGTQQWINQIGDSENL